MLPEIAVILENPSVKILLIFCLPRLRSSEIEWRTLSRGPFGRGASFVH